MGSMLNMNRNRFICFVTCKNTNVLRFILFCFNNSHAATNNAKFRNGPAPAVSALAIGVIVVPPMLT